MYNSKPIHKLKKRLMEIFGEVEELLHYLLDNYRHSFFRQEAIVATAVALKHSLESVANDFIE